jgi:Phage Mu protein F like protein
VTLLTEPEALTTTRDVTREEHQAALDVLIAPVEDLVARELRRVLQEAVDHALALTAAATVDVNALSSVPTKWATVVQAKVTPAVAKVYDTGSLGAFISLEPNRLATPIGKRLQSALPTVHPAAASSYLQQASNRLTRIGDEGWALTRDALNKGLEAGESIPDIQRRVGEAIDVSEGRARVIARTEVVGATNAGSIEGARAVARAGPPPLFKEWLATHDSRTRQTHRDADGQVVALDDPFTVGGASMDRPHDPTGPAREVVNCRCTIVYTDEPPDGYVPPKVGPEGVDLPDEDEVFIPPSSPEEEFRRRFADAKAEFDAITRDRDLSPAARTARGKQAYREELEDEFGPGGFTDEDLDDWWESQLSDEDRERLLNRGLGGNTDPDRGFDLWRSQPGIAEETAERQRVLWERGLTPEQREMRNRLYDESVQGEWDAETWRLKEEASTKVGRVLDDEVERRGGYAAVDDEALLESKRPLEAERNRNAGLIRDREKAIHDEETARWLKEGGESPASASRFRIITDPELDRLKRRNRELLQEIMNATPDRVYLAEQHRVMREVLEEVVEFDDAVDLVNMNITRRSSVYKAAQDAADAYPVKWKRLSDDYRGPKVHPKATTNRAHYRSLDGELLIPKAPGAKQTATAIHEFGHRMEYSVPGLSELEAAFYERRTRGWELAPLRDMDPKKGGSTSYGSREMAREDEFADVYMGKDYGAGYGGGLNKGWELFTMGAQTFLSPRHAFGDVAWGRRIDPDFRRWFLGVVASLG